MKDLLSDFAEFGIMSVDGGNTEILLVSTTCLKSQVSFASINAS